MAQLRLLVPDGTVNYIKNPSFRFGTTGWIAVGSSLSRTLDHARWNIASLQIDTTGASLYEGAYYRVSSLANENSPATGSVYVRGSGFVRIRLLDNPTGKEYASQAMRLNDNRWQRIDVSGRIKGSDDVRLYIETADHAQATTFYVDGAQLELHPYATTYCDGDQDGCYWNVMHHGSVSTRSATTRAGGRWVEIYGKDQAEKDLYMTVVGGMGMAPIRNNIQSFSDAPGSSHQNVKVMDRVVTITFNARNVSFKKICSPVSRQALHELRQDLIDLVKPDKTGGDEEIILEYLDGDYKIYLNVRYDGGLEGEWDLRNQWLNSFPLRLLAVSPFMYEDNQDVSVLDFQERETVNYVMQRLDGQWSEMNGGFNTYANEFTIGKNGEVIAVGQFNKANNDAGAIDPEIFANFVAYWDGTQWNQYGSGANDIINSVAVGPNGYIYVTGAFTSIGGVAANRIAYWDGSSWNAMGTGLGAAGFVVRVAPNGDVYAGGSFEIAGGNEAHFIARYDGTWHPIGLYAGLNNAVYTMDITPDGEQIFIGGAFTDEYGDPGDQVINYVVEYEPFFGQFFYMGDGFDALVRKITVAKSGRVYAVGDFTTSGDQTMLYISYWNGAAWYAVSSGADNTVRDISVSDDGSILIAGDFTRVGAADAQGVALYNGTSWVLLDVDILYNGYSVIFGDNGNMFLSLDGTLATFSGITTVENNSTAEVNPKIYLVGPCTLRWLENQTTHRRLCADLDLLENEDAIIDFAKGTIESSIRGDLSWAVSSGSDMRAWTLVPGSNKIAALMVNDTDAKMYISYVQRHWSVDATKRVEAL